MQTQSKVLKWSLIIGIVIVLNLFFNYALSLVYKSPDYNNYFPQSQVVEPVTTKEACLNIGGQWNENTVPQKIEGTKEVVKGYCDPNFTKQQEFMAAQKVYDRNVFITLVILGALCVAIGSFLTGNTVISIAMSLAGVLSFIIASMRYWSSADNLIKVIILAIVLGILIWVAMKRFKDN
ncbi:MAG: hypothetical protein KBD55_00700 [Candidatus Pacebacteria bacterium]|nr:hypothetical protein [Candidatus Paceibacterota bacterium]